MIGSMTKAIQSYGEVQHHQDQQTMESQEQVAAEITGIIMEMVNMVILIHIIIVALVVKEYQTLVKILIRIDRRRRVV